MKFCKMCRTEKEVNEANFHRLARSSDGFDRYCKLCQNKRGLHRYHSEKGPEIRRKNTIRNFRHKYGITIEDKQKILEAQGLKCACCGSTNSGNKNGWSLDHNHQTEEIRGVLCHSCNVALGSVKDSVSRLECLITYLNSHKPLVMKAVA